MMNAKILTLALAATAMATGCMQKEVVSVPENGSQIGFSTWVGKPTKAVNDLNDNTKFNTFYVFGSYEKEGAYTTVFNNDAVTTSDNGTSWTAPVQYWVPDMEYKFIAYSDGNNKLTDVEFDDASGNLSINNYTVGNNDLIISGIETQTGLASGNAPVALSFKHLLSKVKFTITAEGFGTAVQVNVSELKIMNARYKGSYTTAGWAPAAEVKADGIAYQDFNANDPDHEAEECYVLPQQYDASYIPVVTFKVSVTDGTTELATKEVTVDDATSLLAASGNNAEWKAGYVYNYVATLTPDNVTSQFEKIEFTVDTVEDWNADVNGDSQVNENDDIPVNID